MKNALTTDLLKSVYINTLCSIPGVVVYPTSITRIFRSEYTSKSKKRRRVKFVIFPYSISKLADIHGIPFNLLLHSSLLNAGFKNVKVNVTSRYLTILLNDYKNIP